MVMNSSCLLSGSDSFFSLINLGLSNINVSVINPHWIRSEVISSTISPSFSWNISNSSALVVFWDFHGSSVLLVVECLMSQEIELFSLEWVKSPVGTNTENVILLLLTFGLAFVISNETSFVCGNDSLTESWQFDER